MLIPSVLILFFIVRSSGTNCPAPVPIGCSLCEEETYKDAMVPVPYCKKCDAQYTLNPVFKICDLNCDNNHIIGCTTCSGSTCTGCADVYILLDGKCIPRECVADGKECSGRGTCTQIGSQLMYHCACSNPLFDEFSNCAECLGGYILSGDTCNPRPCTERYTERCSMCNKDGTCYSCKKGFFSPNLDCGSPCPIGCDCDPALNYLKCTSCHEGFSLSSETGLMTCKAVTNCTAKPACMWCDANNVCLTCVSGRSDPQSNCSVPCADIRGCSDCSPTDPNTCIQCIDSETTADRCRPYCFPPHSAGSLSVCAEIYDIYSAVLPYSVVSFYNVRYSTHSYGFIACNKLGNITDSGLCVCYNDPLRDPATTCVECLPGYMLNRYTQRCLKDTLNTKDTHCMVGDLEANQCYTCMDGYYGLAKKCPFECNIENCLRCTDDGQKCIACKQNFDPSTEGLCIPLRILSSCEDESSVTDEGVCTPSCGLPFTCAKEKSGSWACVHPRCVKIINGEKQVCGLKGTCTRAGSCICDDPHTWDFCSTCAPGWTRSSPSSTCDTQDCFPQCSNGGVCQIKDGSPVCRCAFNWNPATQCVTCLPGYTGRNCNIPYCFINEDCEAGQTCVSGKCNDDPCSSNNNLVCNGHGTCTFHNNIRQCTCNPGYSNETNCLTCTKEYYLKNNRCVLGSSRVLSSSMIAGLSVGSIILLTAVALSIYFGVRACQKKNRSQVSFSRTVPIGDEDCNP
ncbi:High cysteine membrane protein Group 2 [Giardia duodenalis]|uniref:High cysteine membrane protein Group 2 n=1 Tax=Giardia intestinalis (strain ATCC 50803 / WB clone C6) TaxID=184922 RepID=A8BS43_GIAIC|nr:High cysteine membrane protein Group 2 [Giardia intestinalis]KAE8304742.1 High cysteine membrane protein Group 2 [Giardia intestinalis]|eukprot:XP_001705146.1 High cysteine membrane protein Group 2 [Giardia lamblia ATCC 50803]